MNSSADDIDPRIAALAEQYEFSQPAVRHVYDAICTGGGDMAMFDHPELRGPGQWMRGGLLMITTPGDRVFHNRVMALCDALSALARAHDHDPWSAYRRVDAEARGWDTAASARQRWWPSEWGMPTVAGTQNDVGYAFFDTERRLAIRYGDDVTLYETGAHHITGIALSQQGTTTRLVLTTPAGELPLDELQPCAEHAAGHDANTGERPAEPAPAEGRQATADILQALEQLGALHQRGVLTDEEFTAKKRELLDRL